MKYETVAEAYRDLERASGRLVLVDRLAALLAATPAELLPVVRYLMEGATVGVDKEHDRARGFVVSAGGVTVVGKGQAVTP